MRETLTILAGLLLAALLAALALPAAIDWSQHRALIESRLKAVAGVEVVTTGPIALRLLPTPRLEIGGVRVGEADARATRLTARRLVAEAEITGFLRGRLAIRRLLLDEAELVVALRGDGAVIPPAELEAGIAPDGVAALAVTRGMVRVVGADGADMAVVPVALQASAPSAGGPWRIEGEAARRSVRIATGDGDGAGRVRTRILIVDGPARIEFDGWAGLAAEAGALRPVAEGAAQMIWPPAQADQPPALQIAGQARLAGGEGEIASLTVESPGAGRLEGQASFAAGGGALELRGRRFDLRLAGTAWRRPRLAPAASRPVRRQCCRPRARAAGLARGGGLRRRGALRAARRGLAAARGRRALRRRRRLGAVGGDRARGWPERPRHAPRGAGAGAARAGAGGRG